MSVGTPLAAEESAPVVSKSVDSPQNQEIPLIHDQVTVPPSADMTSNTTNAPMQQEHSISSPLGDAVHNATVSAIPASEGVLGYKAPGLLKQFRFAKHYFWFSEEPLSKDGLALYQKEEKHSHHHAAWAQETGKGLLFFAKRAEDKSTPAGLILLAEAGGVIKVGMNEFAFKLGTHSHKFEAANPEERDSWVVAVEKAIKESKEMHSEITGRESYKHNVAAAAAPILSNSTGPSTPKKSLDANTAVGGSAAPVATQETTPAVAPTVTESKPAENSAKKDRSQSRKRNSVFGIFGSKTPEEKEAEKQEKAKEKAEKEAIKEEKAEEHAIKEQKKEEAQHLKEEKKAEAEAKKEEAKAEHDNDKAKEAAEAAAVAALPAAAVAKADQKHDEQMNGAADKKNKRTSILGGLFGKNKVTSPSAEKTEHEVGPTVPAKDAETPLVSETAPVLDEPVHPKPIDTAAVVAPSHSAEITPAPIVEPAKTTEPVITAPENTTTPKTEKKSFMSGLMGKKEKKSEIKEEHASTGVEPAVIAATTAAAIHEQPATVPEHATTDAETPAATATEERPAREKRKSSLFGAIGTLKRKVSRSPQPSRQMDAIDGAVETGEPTRREKSPMPSKIGGLFRKPSQSAHTALNGTVDEPKPTAAAETNAVPIISSAPTTSAATETPQLNGEHHAVVTDPSHTTIVEQPATDSTIVGDAVPKELVAPAQTSTSPAAANEAATVKPITATA